MRRSARLAAMTKMLVDRPNRIVSLSEFVDRFGAAKSTVSEDLAIIRDVFAKEGLGADRDHHGGRRRRPGTRPCRPGRRSKGSPRSCATSCALPIVSFPEAFSIFPIWSRSPPL